MTEKNEQSLFERAGGEPALRRVIVEFYDRVFADAMIGFHFRGSDRQRLIEKELELASSLLGADVRYTGKPMREVHAKHHIFGGHFMRRLQILREVLEEQALPPEVRAAWIEHTLKLMPQITKDAPDECRMPEGES
ncbi:MAG: group 1 truncated hemoglobin [Planctomycetota bacterium]